MKITLFNIKNHKLFSRGIILNYKESLVSINREESEKITYRIDSTPAANSEFPKLGTVYLENIEIPLDFQFEIPDYLLNSNEYELNEFNMKQLNRTNF